MRVVCECGRRPCAEVCAAAMRLGVTRFDACAARRVGGSGGASGGSSGVGVAGGNAGDAAADTVALIAAVEAEGLAHAMDAAAVEAARGEWGTLTGER